GFVKMFVSYSLDFSFALAAHRLDRHSFPTRRSSDLDSPDPLAGTRCWSRPEECREVARLFRGRSHRARGREPLVLDLRRRPDRIDRKSTRLNASHVSISYAVFCLKKKK